MAEGQSWYWGDTSLKLPLPRIKPSPLGSRQIRLRLPGPFGNIWEISVSEGQVRSPLYLWFCSGRAIACLRINVAFPFLVQKRCALAPCESLITVRAPLQSLGKICVNTPASEGICLRPICQKPNFQNTSTGWGYLRHLQENREFEDTILWRQNVSFGKTEKTKGLEGSSGKSRVNLEISECLNISFSNLHEHVEQPCHAGQAAVWSIFKKLEGNSQLGLWTNSANYFWTWRVYLLYFC